MARQSLLYRFLTIGLLALMFANVGCQMLSSSRGLPAQWEPDVESTP